MRALRPIKKAIAKKWYFVKFSYEYFRKVPRYNAELDEIVQEDERMGPVELVMNQLAANGAEASRLVREGASVFVRPGTFDEKTGLAIEHKPIEGTVVILGVEEWVPLDKKKEESLWPA
jgi:hypothetical protein